MTGPMTVAAILAWVITGLFAGGWAGIEMSRYYARRYGKNYRHELGGNVPGGLVIGVFFGPLLLAVITAYRLTMKVALREPKPDKIARLERELLDD